MTNSKKMIIFAVIFLLGALAMIVSAFVPAPTLLDGEALSYTEITDDNAFYIQDLAVVYEYATLSGDGDTGSYYLAYFYDKDYNLCTVSLYFDNSKEWKSTSASHDYDATDMMMSGCFSTKKLSSMKSDFGTYYDELLAEFKEFSSTYLGNVTIKDTGLHFKYVCDEKAGYESEAKPTGAFFIGGGLMLLLACLFFYLSKKTKQKEEESSRIQMTTPAYDPYTGAPVAPQNPYGYPENSDNLQSYGNPRSYNSPTDSNSYQNYSGSEKQDNYKGPEF